MSTTFTNKFKKSLQALLVGLFTLLFGFNSIAQVNCSCPGNLVQNPSFENGITDWSSWGVTSSNFYVNTAFPQCGTYHSEFNNNTNTWAGFYQDIQGIVVGTNLTLTAYGGVHDASKSSIFKLEFYNSSYTFISGLVSSQVDAILPSMQQYTITGVVPTGAFYVRVVGACDGGYLKSDQWCLVATTASASCTCPGNIVSNPSFESGTTSWGSSGGNFNAGTGAIACGSYSGDFEITNTGANWVSQTIGTDLPIGSVLNASVYAGTHDNSVAHSVQINFFNASWVWISAVSIPVNKVISAAPVGPQLYTFTATVPANTKYTQAIFSGNGGWIKTDNWCVTIAAPTCDNVTNGGTIGSNQTVCGTGASSDPAPIVNIGVPTGGTGNLEYVWMYKYGDLSIAGPFTIIPGATGSTYDPGPITQTTNYIRCARRAGCTSYITGESNIITVTYVSTCPNSGSIGDRVWGDANGNGIQDAGENGGFAGVTIQLKNAAGTVIATTNTDVNGYYLFSGLAAGNYTVVFPNNINGTVVTTQNAGSDDNIDSDANQTTGETDVITLAAGQAITNVDAGYCPTTLKLGNRVWDDVNNDGLNNNEAGIAGVTVNLYKDNNNDNIADGGIIETVVTDANGFYTFINLAPGNYIVGVVRPSGYVSSSVNGGDPDNDINLDDNGQITVGNETRGLAITLTGGGEPGDGGTPNDTNVNITYDFGFYLAPTGSIGNFVWNDVNGNGLQDAGEPGLSGVQVQLLNAAGAVIATTTTDASGAYQFTGLPAATYTVKFLAVAGYGVSPANIGSNDAIDSDVDGTGSVTVVLGAGESNQTIDAGFCPTTLALGDRVFADLNNNGIRDAAELGIAGVTVNIYQDANNDNVADGPAFATTTTDANGNYLFSNLLPGNYIVGVVNPTGYASSTVNAADPDNDIDLDDNGSVAVGNETRGLAITLTGGGEPGASNTNLTYDFGFYPTNILSLGNVVWSDLNNNGTKDAGEPGVAAVTVYLFKDFNNDGIGDNTGNPDATTTTDANGIYTFTGLLPGTYFVGVQIPTGYVIATVPATGTNANNDTDNDNNLSRNSLGYTVSSTIELSVGGEPTTDGDGSNGNLTVDFGLYNPYVGCNNSLIVDDFITTSNIIANASRPSPTSISASYTNAGSIGGFMTNSIAAKNALLANTRVSSATYLGNYEVASAAGDSISNVMIWDGDSNPALNPTGLACKNIAPYQTLDFVYTDDRVAGTVETFELTLYTSATSASKVLFTHIAAGNNIPSFVSIPLSSLTAVSGSTPVNLGCVGAISLKHDITGVDNNGLDFYMSKVQFCTKVNPASLGDFVFSDLNANGIQDAGEPGISGATVTLTNSNGNVIGTKVTDANGAYSFTGLVPSTYSVTFTTPAGYTPTTSNVGSDDTKDSDPVSGVVSGIVLTAGQNNSTIDAGFKGAARLGNFVWNDANGNGVQNSGDLGISSATVNLYKDANGDNVPDGAATATTTTNTAGNYLFSNLTPGSYIVGVVIPAGYVVTSTTATSATPNNDNNTDNNGVTTVSGELRSNNIALIAGTEPTTDGDDADGNLTLDFGLRSVPLPVLSVVSCNDNGTSLVSTDDYITFRLNADSTNYNKIFTFSVTATRGGSPIALTLSDGSAPVLNAGFDQPFRTANGTAGGGNIVLTILSSNGTTSTITLTDPGTCSPATPCTGTTSTVTYTYRTPLSATNVIDKPILLPKFDNAGGARKLTQVNLTYTSNTVGTAVVENTSAGPVSLNFKSSRGIEYKLNGAIVTLVPSAFIFNDAASIPTGNVLVPAQGAWQGDSLNVFNNPVTLDRMNQYGFNNYMDSNFGANPTGSPAWVTNITGNATNDDDMYVWPAKQLSETNSNTYTTANDLLNFQGTGNIPFTFSDTSNSLLTINGGNNVFIHRTKAYTDVTITYTYECSILNLGNAVWYDQNNNGTKDATDPVIAGVTVNLYRDANNDGVADGVAIATTNTDASGLYNFSGLSSDNYIVGVVTPAGYAIQTLNGGDPDNNVDNDNNGVVVAGTEIRSNPVTLTLGGEPATGVDGDGTNGNLTVDFGLKGNGVIGNFVFNDTNGNGIQDAGETGIAGTTVTLTYPNGQTVSTTTDAAGNYSFPNLAPTAAGQTYSVAFTTPSGYTPTGSNVAGSTEANDSDPIAGVVSGLTLTPGQVNNDVDAGFYQVVNLGNAVWYDQNNNGIKNNTDPVIAGATVNLYRDSNNDGVADGAAIATTTTDVAGLYSFGALKPDTYIVGVVTPAGYAIQTINGGDPDNDVDGDNNGVVVAGTEIRSNPVTLTAGGEPASGVDADGTNGNLTVDFGLKGTASIGDFVFNDTNGNGVQDAGETGIAGTTVTLTYPNGQTVTTTTDAAGAYNFPNLAPTAAGQTYSVAFTTPSGLTASPANQGTDDAKDSDPIAGVVTGITLTAGQANTTVDAGFFAANVMNLGNTVWYDLNNNGIKDGTEKGIPSATVMLYLDANNDNVADGAAIATTTTDANGLYNFGGLAAGNYIVGVTIPAGYKVVTTNGGDPDNNTDNDNNGVVLVGTTEVRSNAITLALTTEPTTDGDGNNGNLTVDFGLTGTGSIGNFVFNDIDGDGIQDAGEPGIAGVTVTLTYPDGTTVTTTTDAAGNYNFPNLAPGTTYSVAFGTPGSYLPTGSNVPGSTDLNDSDPIAGVVTNVTVVAGVNNDTVDAGFYQVLNLGNAVWYDQNNNGTKDATDPVLAGLTVNLYVDANNDGVADGAIFATTTTDAAGLYNFAGLKPDTYIVGVVTPTGYSIQPINGGDPDNNVDNDNNGVVVVGTEIRSNPVTLTTGGEPATGVDGDGTNGNLTVDFGLKGTGVIGNFVFNDTNGNGIQDAGETGIAGTTVTLTYPNGQTVSTTTDAAGNYSFPNLAPTAAGQTYSVTFGTPSGYTPTGSNVTGSTEANDSDPIGGVVTGLTLTPGQVNNDVDAGFFQVVNLGNVVFFDQNNNGTKDATDPIIAGVTVNLYRDTNNDGVADGAAIATTTTDAAGVYSFTGLKPDTYIVGIVTPAGYAIQTINGGDPDNNVDNDNNGVVVAGTEIRSNPITLTAGAEPAAGVDGDGTNGNLTVDFGLKGTASIGDFVFNDTNGNGVQDAGEAGIPGATVTLTYPNGQTVSTTTDANGGYNFPNLAPTAAGQTYSVAFTTPSGLTASPANQGTDDAKDSDPIAGVVSGITLTAGQANTTVDAGFYTANVMNLGNTVWYDSNNNGVKDGTEKGIPSATVLLYVDANNDGTPDGAAIATTTTDANGLYNFGGLAAGNYIVGVTIPAGYKIVTTNGGDPDNNIDNDNNGVVPVGTTEVRSNTITLALLTEPTTDGDGSNGNLTVDFALTGTGSIGNFVFNDTNGNGIQDAGEAGIPGVTVTLTYPDGSTTTTTTDANGNYNFPNLAPGTTYSVVFGTPSGFNPATPNQGGDDNTDSDPIGGVVTNVTVVAGVPNNTVDAGFFQFVNLGNAVWYDQNNNGTKDATDPVIAGATVNLYVDANNDGIADGVSIATTTTDAAGLYNFNGLKPDTYIVAVVTPAGYAIQTINGGDPDNNVDNDNNGVVVVGTEIRSNPVTLTAGGEPAAGIDGDGTSGNLTVDFGLKGNGAIGNFVFNDANGNGIQDAGDAAIPGATVTLTYPNGQTVSTTTDASGAYSFPNLAPTAAGQTYSVTFVTPAGFTPTTSNIAGSTEANDSDPIAGVVAGITLAPSQVNNDVDAGFFQVVNLGNAVWYDQNNNGIKDATDPAIVGATVNLYKDSNNDGIADGAAIATTTTDAAGLYNFTGLKPDTYIVGVVTPAGYAIQPLNGGDPDNNVDNDNNGVVVAGTEIRSNPVTLTTGGEPTTGVDGDGTNGNLTVDFGLKGTGVIGNFVFDDKNGNGIQDAGETGIAGTTVTLTYPNGQTVTTTTDAAGNYSFPNLAPTAAGQTYSVTFVTPAGFTPTTSNIAGSTEANDSDPIAGVVTGITLNAGQVNNDVDAGFFKLAALGNFVWNDLNADGIQDANEPGFPGVTVTLTKPDNTTLTATTDNNGAYSFTGLNPGVYKVTFAANAAYLPSPANVGADDAKDSDPIAGVVNNITLVSGQTDNTIDAGFYLCTLTSGITGPTTICANEQTLFSATPSGVGSVYTWTFGGGATPSTATGLSANPSWPTTGEYPITLFVTRNGCSVSYNTTIVITQGVFAAAGPDKDICQGSSTTINGSGPVGATYNWNVVIGDPTSIDNGANQQSVLVSPLQTTVYQLTVTQNGCTRTDQITVFINVNKNPVADAGPNKVVTVNHPIAIGGSPTGTAPLATPTAPLGYSWTAVTGLNDATIPNPSATLSTPGTYNYQVIVYSLLSGCSDTSVMQLTVLPGLKLGNTVWYDKNNNGIKDAGEAPIATAVKLYRDDNADNVPDGAAILTTTSSALGVYGFADLEPGNYIVGATIPSGYKVVTTNGGDPDNNVDNDNSTVSTVGTEARSLGITLAVGAEPAVGVDGDDTNGNMTVDFGFTGNSSIGNFVFYDSNRDGIQTTGEVGIAGVTVTLTFPDATTATTTTAADGSYNFPNLIPGNYSVAFTTPLGNIPTQSNVTTPGATDLNDSDPVGGVVAVTLGANEDNATIDAGFHSDCTGTIRGTVFHDVDGMDDGTIDNITDTTGLPDLRRVPTNLRISLVDLVTLKVVATGNLSINGIQGTPSYGTGSFILTNVPVGSYYIVLSNIAGVIGNNPPPSRLPTRWISTGEKVGTGSGRDTQVNGLANISMTYECINMVKFGIKFVNDDIGLD